MVTDQSLTFAALLRRYRTAAGLTQEQLAERAGLSRRGISDLERGARTRPWPDTVRLLAEALSLSTQERNSLERAIARTRRPAAEADVPEAGHLLTLDPTPLLGREREEAAIVQLLQRDDGRLLTLTGAGGVGKTRLALRAASLAAPAYAGGVRVVPLAPVRKPEHLISAIARALGLQETRGQTLRQVVENVLNARPTLLLLDNVEHLLAAAPLLSELLASCPRLAILATSREPLHLRGEHELAVQPLALPPARSSPSERDLARYPATALFLSRARAANLGLNLGPGETTAIAEICRRLDGLPLAIELAAAQLKYESPEQLLDRLKRRFEVLVGGPRDAPVRQQTMRACIAWSYDLLDPIEQEVLCRLAVFVGGATADGAEEVLRAGGNARGDILPLIHSLVDKSLLLSTWSDRRPPRFTMLETIREYALERLEESGQSRSADSTFARYFARLAEEADVAAWGPDEVSHLRRLAAERDNLRAALAWALEHDVELGLSMGGNLVRFWNVDGHYGDWRRWIELALLAGGTAAPSVRVKASIAAGWMALQEGDIASALGHFQQALTLARALEDPLLILRAIPGLGFAQLAHGEVTSATALFEEGIAICRAFDATHMLGSIEYGVGLAAQVTGDLDLAREQLEGAVTLFRDHGEQISIGSAQRALGGIALAQGDFQRARAWFHEGLQTAILTDHRDGIAIALEGIAGSLAALGRLESAARLYGAAEALHEELHGPATNGAIPFARHPQLSPQLVTIAGHFNDPRWKAAQSAGYAAPLDETIASLPNLD